MRVVAIVSQKGGTGKTTLAISLAVEATRRGGSAAIIDLDPQVSAFNWYDLRDEPPIVIAPQAAHLDRRLKALREAATGLAIIDTAGRTTVEALAAVRAAESVLMPVQPSLVDLQTTDATMDIVRLAGGKPVRAVLTRVKPFGSRHSDTVAWLQAHGIETCPAMLGERVVYQDAYGHGLSAAEADPNGKAATEIAALYDALGLPAFRPSGLTA